MKKLVVGWKRGENSATLNKTLEKKFYINQVLVTPEKGTNQV